MALPLPSVVSDVGPGGGLVTAMGGINALNNAMILRKINQIKAQYAPITAQADAASKLAYANLMGPQFLAKIMGNDSALANMSEEQKRAALDIVRKAGMGQGSGMNAFNQMQQGQGLPTGIGQPSTNTLSGWFANKLKNSFDQNPLTNPFVQQQDAIQPLPQQKQINQSELEGQNTPNNKGINNISDQELSAYDEWLRSPEGLVELEKGENGKYPTPKQALEWQQQKNTQHEMQLTLTKSQKPKTYAENTGQFKGIVQEAVESGKIRAKDIDDLNTAVFNAETNAITLNDINDILASPEFEQIRQVPLAGHHELSYYAREGTPEQQDMVGRYYTLTGNLIKDASRDFAGQFRKGEQSLLQGMKPGPSDTVDVAKGKSGTLTILNKMLMERSRLTSKIMAQNHVNKLQAMEEADKLVNGEQIRREVHDRLNPTVTIRNKKTGETKTISAAEARKLGVPNV